MLESDAVALNPNKLVRALDEPADDFTKSDIIVYIEANNIQMLNRRYLGGDGRLKMLNFSRWAGRPAPRQRYVPGDASKVPGLDQLPTSCFESAERLLDQRASYEADDVFPPGLIDSWAARLQGYGDHDLRTQLLEQKGLLDEMVRRYFHIG